MLTHEQSTSFTEILEALARTLDITESQYHAAVKSYEAVGLHLAKHDSMLEKYDPEILPQGSFMLGTMIQPIHGHDDLDIDLVCQLTGKPESWTQHDLKQAIGDQLKAHGTYEPIIKQPEGRRCWTLIYSENANYHLDILPCIVDAGYRILLTKAFSHQEMNDINELSLRITDRQNADYNTETNHLRWRKSNPFGYARWFFQQAALNRSKGISLNESIQPVPEYQTEKLPLQRIIQILKRHRDLMFEGDADKPISIIITTLAALAYQQQTDIAQGLLEIVEWMPHFIEERFSSAYRKPIKWIGNPVNMEENFADKWPEHPQKEARFYQWMQQVAHDLRYAVSQHDMQSIQAALSGPFGGDAIAKTFSNLGSCTFYRGKNQVYK